MAKKQSTGAVAKERLKNVLREDRSQMTSSTITAMKADILGVIRGYANINEEDMNFYLIRGTAENETKLMMEAVLKGRKTTAS